MNGFYATWTFTRERLAQAVEDLTDAQAAWKPRPGAHSTTEMLYHLAGAEHWFACRLKGESPHATEFDRKLDDAVRAEFITDAPFPFSGDELTLAGGLAALEYSFAEMKPVMENPTPEMLERPIETAFGPIVPGIGGLQRIAQHSAYHTGQIWMMRMSPDFPVG